MIDWNVVVTGVGMLMAAGISGLIAFGLLRTRVAVSEAEIKRLNARMQAVEDEVSEHQSTVTNEIGLMRAEIHEGTLRTVERLTRIETLLSGKTVDVRDLVNKQ